MIAIPIAGPKDWAKSIIDILSSISSTDNTVWAAFYGPEMPIP